MKKTSLFILSLSFLSIGTFAGVEASSSAINTYCYGTICKDSADAAARKACTATCTTNCGPVCPPNKPNRLACLTANCPATIANPSAAVPADPAAIPAASDAGDTPTS